MDSHGGSKARVRVLYPLDSSWTGGAAAAALGVGVLVVGSRWW